MKIYIKILDKRDVEIEVEAKDTIRDVKENVRSILRIPRDNELEFEYHNSILEDEKTVKKYGIKEGAIINVMRKKGAMQLFARTMDGETVAFEALKSDSIQNIKEKINKKTGLSMEKQKLFYQGTTLDDEKSVEYYRIRDKSVIKVVPRFRNGMWLFSKTWDGTRYRTTKLYKACSIQNIKEILQVHDILIVEHTNLKYQDTMLDDKKSLEYYQIECGYVINTSSRLKDGVRLFAKTWDGTMHKIEVLKSDSIRDIKKEIRTKTELSEKEQKLIYKGAILQDKRSVEYYRIRDKSVINVVPRNGMRLFVKTKGKKTVAIEVHKSDSIQNMKEQIRKKTGLNDEKQKLVFQGEVLEDKRTLEDYQMVDKSVIDIVTRLRINWMRLFAKTRDGRKYAIYVQKSDSIQNIKEKIWEKSGLSLEEHNLVYEGAILDKKKSVGYYQIEDGSVINVLSRSEY